MAGQIALLDVDIVRFITMNFSKERELYTYNGSKRLNISDADQYKLLQQKTSTYQYLRIDDRRKHFERIHEKFEQLGNYPAIQVYEEEKQNTLIVKPIEYYSHAYYSSNIDYRFNQTFINWNNLFQNGYRDICLNALDRLTGRYSRFFFIYLSGDMYEFRFSEEKLRKLLNIENKYKKRNAIGVILEGVRNELKTIDIDFDYSYCTKAEWEEYKRNHDEPAGELPAAGNRKKNKKNKTYTKNFYFRAKGMDKYRIPKGTQSVFSHDIAANRQYGLVRSYFNKELKMTDNYIHEKWEYIKRYINEYGAQTLIDFAGAKMKEMAKQKKKPRNPKSVLMSIIVNRVKDLDTEGRGDTTLFSIPEAADYDRYDPTGKTTEEIIHEINKQLSEHPPNTS